MSCSQYTAKETGPLDRPTPQSRNYTKDELQYQMNNTETATIYENKNMLKQNIYFHAYGLGPELNLILFS